MKVECRSVSGFTRVCSAAAGYLLVAMGVTALAGCSGGGSVNVGSGQTPDPATVDFPIF
jgi:hypothetical protein